jgi:nucleoside-diphosphate-sugar epimerase
MKVFLTGASGFIGSHVARLLVNRGYDVLALVLPNETHWRLADINGKINMVKGNLYDVASYRPALIEWQPEVCIHLAWYVEPGKYLHSPENISVLNASLTLLQTLSE